MINNIFYQKNMFLVNLFFIIFIVVIYSSSVLHIYTPYRVDDAWFTSFIYNDYVHNIRTDEVFGGNLSNGLGGTQLFGKIYTAVYGSIASIFNNWSKQFLYTITEVLMLLSVLVWGLIARHYHLSNEHVIILCLSMLLSQTFFAFSHSVRPEIFILFFSSLSLLCFIKYKYGLSILFAFIAIETHPIGSITIFMILAVLNHQQIIFFKENIHKLSIYIITLGIICISFYLMLHGEFIEKTVELKKAYMPLLSENFLVSYYTFPKYYHTLPEALLIGFSVIIYIQKKLYQSVQRDIGFLFISLIIFSVIINRDVGGVYAILAYPLFFLLIFLAFIKIDKLGLLLLLLVAFYIPKYTYVYYRNLHSPNFDVTYQEKLKYNLPPDSLPVIGLPNDYWVFMHNRRFYTFCYINIEKFNQEISKAWLLEHTQNEFFNFYQNLPCPNQDNIEKNYRKEFIKAFDGNNIKLYKITRI